MISLGEGMNRNVTEHANKSDILSLCYKRLNQAGLSPSELSSDGLRLLVWCAIRDQLAAIRK